MDEEPEGQQGMPEMRAPPVHIEDDPEPDADEAEEPEDAQEVEDEQEEEVRTSWNIICCSFCLHNQIEISAVIALHLHYIAASFVVT